MSTSTSRAPNPASAVGRAGRGRLAWLGFALWVGAAGCGAAGPVTWNPGPSSTGPVAQDELDYADQRRLWTRHAENYFDLEARILVDATLFSPGFARALAQAEGELQGLTTAERAPRLAAAMAGAQRETAFLVAMVTNQFFWNDLDHPEGIFRAHLLTAEGKVLEPLGVERLEERQVVALRPLFPYIQMSSVVYRLRFPALAEPRPVTLRIAGTPGAVELTWELQ